jgi:hypothetical protein
MSYSPLAILYTELLRLSRLVCTHAHMQDSGFILPKLYAKTKVCNFYLAPQKSIKLPSLAN